ncbi:MAG: NAD(P)H-dependent oxidoreductase [Hyphomicrobiales bacterium]|nr:NAD(P)H-dependent oxidoreductase [Hyphomicrobiales bacterium]
MKQILVIDAHPTSTSLCSALAKAYCVGASNTGTNVQTICLRDLEFDPILHEGYSQRQEWEPDLSKVWEAIQQANHLCFVYPTWWGGHPALLQGLFERVFLPGKAFKYHETGSGWDKLLAGRSAEVLTTMDSPYWYYRLINRNGGIHRIKKTILEFVGMKTKVHVFDNVRNSSQSKRERWIEKVEKIGTAIAQE